MNKLKIKFQREIINYLINNFNNQLMRVDEYLNEYIEEIVKDLKIDMDVDDIIYELADMHNINSRRFIELLLEEIRIRGINSRIKLIYMPPFHYIELSNYGSVVNVDLRKNVEMKMSIFKKVHNKGYKYQKFCACLLKDFGFVSIISKNTNDKGIDIFAKYNTKIENALFNYFNLLNEIYVLVQVKCYENKIEATVLKKLIQDSLYLRIKENEEIFIANKPALLIAISNSGFTQEAVRFAEKNKVFLISSDKIIDFLCCVGSIDNLTCIKYIDEIVKIKKVEG